MAADEDRYLVPGLVRGLKALQCFTPETPNLSLKDISERLGITRSAAFRTVYTLAEMGCLIHDQRTNTYSVGPGILRLSYGYLATREIVEIAQPELERLRDELNWSAHMGVLDGTSVLYVLRVPAHYADASIVHVGSRLPARNTAIGRVMLADLGEDSLLSLFRSDNAGVGQTAANPAEVLAQARADRGAEAIVHAGHFEAGIASVAAPVRDMTGRVVAGINVTAPISEHRLDELNGPVRAKLIETASRISRLLGWQVPEGGDTNER